MNLYSVNQSIYLICLSTYESLSSPLDGRRLYCLLRCLGSLNAALRSSASWELLRSIVGDCFLLRSAGSTPATSSCMISLYIITYTKSFESLKDSSYTHDKLNRKCITIITVSLVNDYMEKMPEHCYIFSLINNETATIRDI